jgi:hypothetical protein
MRGSRLALLALWALCAASGAQAAEKKKLALGVFLPTTLADGQERLRFAEKLAAGLGAALGEPVVGRSFGRYEDFSRAASDGSLDVAVVDAWAAAESTARFEPISLGSIAGDTAQRWAVIAREGKGSVKDLKGKKLAVTHGGGSYDAKFVTNLIFAGDLDAQKHFKLVSVPSVESALKALEVKSAEAALVPLLHVPKTTQVFFKSGRLPGAVVLTLHGRAPELQTALRSLGAVEPFERFSDASPSDVSDLRRALTSGPAHRQPVMAESPLLRLDTSTLVNARELGPVLPPFVETMEIAKEQPDD